MTALLDYATQHPWWTLTYLVVIVGGFVGMAQGFGGRK